MRKDKKKMVIVEWIDSCSNTSRVWHRKDDLEDFAPDVIQSVGFLETDKKDYILLVPHKASDCYSGFMAIPKCAIKSMKKLNESR